MAHVDHQSDESGLATRLFAGAEGAWAVVRDAHVAMAHPTEINAAHIFNGAVTTATAFAILFVFDKLFARMFVRRYFALHVFANIVITWLTICEATRGLLNPCTSTIPLPGAACSMIFVSWVYALHIYHPLFFKTGVMDWVHHVPVYILNTLMFSVLCGEAVLLKAVILCGIPGGIDYFLQVLEGEGRLSRAEYKDYCAHINNWCRVPLGCISGYILLAGLHQQWELARTRPYDVVVLVLMGVHAIWNVHFFGRQAVEANIIDTINRYRLESGSIKLPQVPPSHARCSISHTVPVHCSPCVSEEGEGVTASSPIRGSASSRSQPARDRASSCDVACWLSATCCTAGSCTLGQDQA